MPPTSSDHITIGDEDELNQQIEEQVNEWSANSNECFTIKLMRSDGSEAAEFQPEFTYPMFGEEEAIFGYQGLDITLTFTAHDLRPLLDISYDKIFEAQGDVRPTDIKEALKDFLPASALEGTQTDSDSASFQPPGEKIREYRRNGKTYQVWCASLKNSVARTILTNMQILVPMFIEGGSLLELEHDWSTQRWKLFLLYEIHNSARANVSPYTLAGFGTSYRTFTFPDRRKEDEGINFLSPNLKSLQNLLYNSTDCKSPLELSSRERLSQFFIFPPNQGAGHGEALYNTMYAHLATPANVREFTVEDPNEKFDDLRDFCDLLYLRANNSDFAALRINTDIPADKLKPSENIPIELIVPAATREKIMRETKIMPRQFDRLVEMHTLSFIPPIHRSRSRLTRKEKATNENDKAYYFWRLYVKQRLYIFNRDQLIQVEHAERVEKLDAALDSVLEAYVEMIDKVEAREQAIKSEQMGEEQPARAGAPAKRKRRIVADDDDYDEEGGAAQPVVANGQQGKKARVS